MCMEGAGRGLSAQVFCFLHIKRSCAHKKRSLSHDFVHVCDALVTEGVFFLPTTLLQQSTLLCFGLAQNCKGLLLFYVYTILDPIPCLAILGHGPLKLSCTRFHGVLV